MFMLLASLKIDASKEFCNFDSQPDALSRYIRERVQWLKWDDAPVRKHHLMDGGAAGTGIASCAGRRATQPPGARSVSSRP